MGGARTAFVILLVLLAGCTRTHYRTRADRDAYSILEEKTWGAPWMLPGSYAVQPHPSSRFFDPTLPDDPLLPPPAPQLYAYELPDLPERDSSRFRPGDPVPLESLGGLAGEELVQRTAHGLSALAGPVRHLHRLPPVEVRLDEHRELIAAVAYDDRRPAEVARADLRWLEPPAELPMPEPGDASPPPGTRPDERYSAELTLVDIPESYWNDIPRTCLRRMFEFESLRTEYEKSFTSVVPQELRDTSQRLTLEDIVDLAQINSREYQTQKELLYRVALRLSLERFDYDLKFSTNGHSTAADFTHDRSAGITVNTLSVPTTFQGDKVLLTGGDFLARFANSVLLTFNGPDGFAADIGSDLLFDFSQSVFQNDVRFEQLTQAERDVVYAARDFAQFRKDLFTQLASDYYNLILSFRDIEIQAQDYFNFVRSFLQSEAEYQTGLSTETQSRLEVDQVEQQVLNALSALISECNGLEQSLDSLKIRIGLPTETPLNLDLTELNQLTLRDEVGVTAELVRRVRHRLNLERSDAIPQRLVMLNYAEVMIERILNMYDLQERLGRQIQGRDDLETLRAQLQVEIAKYSFNEARAELEDERQSDSPSDPVIFQRTIDTLDQLMLLIDQQLNLVERLRPEAAEMPGYRQRLEQLFQRTEEVRDQIERLITEPDALVAEAIEVLEFGEQLTRDADLLLGVPTERPAEEVLLQQTNAEVDRLLALSGEILQGIEAGLVPIEIGVDEAMLTALVLRFDLVNERGFLADDWRQIKLAADDLRSVLNLNASQTIGTPRDRNRPFAFTFDESRTDLQLTFDLPVNRRAQRNSYRQTLIDYNAALRRLMQLEDNVKLSVRNDLRSLAFDQQQYRIAIASAALSFERVNTTSIEYLVLGTATARDYIEAQQTYTGSLSAVARQHIGYILDRMQLFLDLELLTVDESGFWQQLYDEQYQPEPYYQLPPYATPVYGELPHVWHSKRIKRMLRVPPGTSMIHQEGEPVQGDCPPAEPLLHPLPPPVDY